MTPEGKVKKEIKEYLDSLGVRCRYFMTQNTGMGESGVADIIGVYMGTAFAIEVKADEKKKPTPWQVRFLDSWRAAGGVAFVAPSVQRVQDIFKRDLL